MGHKLGITEYWHDMNKPNDDQMVLVTNGRLEWVSLAADVLWSEVSEWREWEPAKAIDVQEGGNHYKDMKIQPIEYIHANNLDYLAGNVVKYISRHKKKNGIEDVKKAIHYCQLILELQYDKSSTK
jgi:hypothetical protein